MSQPERQIMADASSAETGGSTTAVLDKPANQPGVEGATPATEKPSAQPNVVKAAEEGPNRPSGIGDWVRRRFGSPQVQVLVNPEDDSIPEQAIGTERSPGGDGAQPPGGDGGGNGGSTGPENPEPPERDWGIPEDIWSAEFRKWGISWSREIIYLEAEPNKDRYDPQKHRPQDPRYGTRLTELYVGWRVWKNMDRKRANNRRPFQPLPEGVLSVERVSTQAAQKELTPQDLSGLPSLKEIKDKDGNVTERGLLNTYNSLRDGVDPDNPGATPDEIEQRKKETEEQLNKYFIEAKIAGLLGGVDPSLKLMYVDIMRGVYPSEKNRRLSPAEIWGSIKESKAAVSELGNTSFQALKRSNRGLVQRLEKLDGVWDVYAELAIDKFSLLLNGGGLIGEPTIAEEFYFGGESLEELNQFAGSDEQLRKLLPSDEELRIEATEAFSEDDEQPLREKELARLVSNRERSLRRAIHDREEAVGRSGEDRARYRQMAEQSELYWAPMYASYFEVSARTPEQFQIAVETFIQWIRSGLTKSPNEIFQRARGFIDALTTAGQRERANVSDDFMIGLRWELEGMVAVLGASHANENYKVDYFEQFMNFGAADEGPERFVRQSRAYRGKLGAILHKFDNDPKVELLHSPHGSRGQLMERRDPLAWEELQRQEKNLLIAEVMGLEIKRYHPDDPEKVINNDSLEENLGEIANFHSDEYFKNLYEGFDLEEQERLYQELSNKQRIANKVREDRKIFGELKSGQSFELKPVERAALRRLERVRRIQQYLANGMDPGGLKGDDKRLYQEAKNAVDSALELYGVMAEKARRGGGVFLVDRNTHIEAYQKIKDINDRDLTQEQRKSKRIASILMQVRKGRKIDESALNRLSNEDRQFLAALKEEDMGDFVDYLPNFWAEKWVHFGENWVKATYGGELDPEIQEKLRLERRAAGEAQLRRGDLSAEERRKIEGWMGPKGIFADELQYRVDQARRMAIWGAKVYGWDAKLWDFTLLRNGKPIDPNTLGYVKDSLGVPYGINHNGVNDVEKYKYAVPVNPRILGYNSKGEGVILVFDDEGKPVVGGSTGLVFDENTGRAVIYDQKEQVVTAVDKDGKEYKRTRQPITFDNLNRNTKAEPMQLKTPTGTIDPKTGKMIVEGEPEKVHIDFDAIIHRFRSHPYEKWTGHPYWGYQEEDTGLVLTEDAFEDAEKIKQGLLRPEDAEPHATQLLIVDPTLQRVTYFKHRESREDKVLLAAVEDSYQGQWLIQDELNMAFFPEDADDEYNRIAYVEQDWGGSTKMWLNPKAIYARWTDMLGRRGRTMLPVLPLHFSSMAGMHGADGALGELRMMNYGMGSGSSYRMVGQFALEKWIGQTEAAQDEFEALTGFVNPQEKRDREGYLEKPTDDADVTLQKHAPDIPALVNTEQAATNENIDIEFMADIRKSRGRKERVIQTGRVLETSKRGERAPRWLKGIDVFERNYNGSIKILGNEKVFNGKVDSDRDVGSSRHSFSIFFWRDVAWVRSDKHWEGQETYRNVRKYYQYMDLPQIAEIRLQKEAEAAGEKYTPASRWVQEHGKEVR